MGEDEDDVGLGVFLSAEDEEAEAESASDEDNGSAQSARPQIHVQLGLEVLHVWAVDIKNESFKVEARVLLRWPCPEEHAEEAAREGADALDVDWIPEWLPRISVRGTTAEEIEWPA